MNTNYFVFIGIFVNVILSVLFPMQIFGNDPFGIEERRISDFDNSGYFNNKVRESYTETDFFTTDGTMNENDGYFARVLDAGEDGSQVTLFGDEGFGFLDWFRVGWELLKNIFTFVFAFIILLLALPAPFNVLFAGTFGGAYVYSLLRLVINR
jgi:hypothetical protein